ncbi:glycosyltransferase [Methanococcoides sp. NM1]|uniref:glycosyltransferase n=1 Tax=Methanococcoides sp. NM1 TaxID=1201013 RepID=UPI001082671B|nr:glycosyltransferase [Methanococcoides sp. NM1]
MKKNKNALVILASPFYLDKGSSVRARSNIIALANADLEIDLLTYPVGNDYNIINVNHIRCKIPFYKKVSAGPSLSKMYADILLFLKASFLMITKKYDIVIGEDFEGGFIGLVLSKFFKKQFIYEMYNPLNETLRPYINNSMLLHISAKIDSFLEKGAKNITVEWKYEKERILSNYSDKNISLVHDAFPKEIKPLQNFNENKYVFYAGNFKDYQGIPFFIKAFKKYFEIDDKISLVLAGGNYQEVQKYAQKLNMYESVIFTGNLSLIETNYFIKNSLFCILPRVIDGPPGMKALHYFSQAKSILATNLSCNSKLVENNKSGLLVEPNVDDMSKGIQKMVNDEEFRKSLEYYILEGKIGTQEKANEGMQDLVLNLK